MALSDLPDSTINNARPEQVDRLCESLRTTSGPDGALLCDFALGLFGRLPRSPLADRSLEEMAILTKQTFAFLDAAGPEGVNVEVVNPEAGATDRPITVIRAELRDRPFIVDTIREYLKSEDLPVEQYIYRVLGVKRGDDGRVTAVETPGSGDARSLVYCEVPRIDSESRREALRDGVAIRLRDVVDATDDFQAMLAAVDDTIGLVDGYRSARPEDAEEFGEIVDFLEWLKDGSFIFLGYRAYEVTEREGERLLQVGDGTGLGILRKEEESTWAGGRVLDTLPDVLKRRLLGGPILIMSKTNAESTVHRRGRMDYIGIKQLGPDGTVVGERRFIGLFTSKAYAGSAEAIPILRRKLAAVLEASGATLGSHDYKEIITIFNSMPKEDLFQASPAQLGQDIQSILKLFFSDDVHVTLRSDPLERGFSVMIILPREKFSSEIRYRIQDLLGERLEGEVLNYYLAMGSGDQVRLHFQLSSGLEHPIPDSERAAIAIGVQRIIRSWNDWLLAELTPRLGVAEGARVAAAYAEAFPEEYRAATLPVVAVEDVLEFERMRRESDTVALTIREPRGRGRAEVFRDTSVLKLYLSGEHLILSDFMPILENAGLRVIEVTPYIIAPASQPAMMIYAFAVQDPESGRITAERGEAVAESILAVRRGEALNDPFNTLVLRAGLSWVEVDILRAYASYAFQAGLVPTRSGAARPLAQHPALARLLVDLFIARFDPDVGNGDRETRTAALQAAIIAGLEGVNALADDRAIRRLAGLIDATVRTNFFQTDEEGDPKRSGGVEYLSIKIGPAAMEELRSPLLYEVFVHSARMEGIHLRGSDVSRGGIRWSDRHDDFRTEVLSLVQTQIVKNAVIVPGGSKGGFVTLRAFADRGDQLEEAKRQYQTFIRGLLDITDNIVDGEIVSPQRVVRHDGDDPYLVVAADKGTAHLSDVANEVAAEYGFWLGDAFASGGSQGYDHKKEGITARGGWECVKRHFREMGKDIQREPFTAVGIGDMSGDVFGNGMLLSPQTRLVAAFDHRHIFIDPDPDPASTFAERERLFALPRSSWDDYDRTKLSPGGMIVSRASKEVQLTPEVRRALGLGEEIVALEGERVVQAVLRAPVELLWNGGIGTYVKSSEETNTDAGDTGNDAVRVNARELRCAVIGEGGNLGMTQAARVEYALAGGRLNTDALDNSAGVDMSDHEVNLKILLAPAVESGRLSQEERNQLLVDLTDEVSLLVLQDNIEQSLAVSLDELRSREALADFSGFIATLERDRALDRRSEGIPGVDELQERMKTGVGLTRPTLAVLLAHAKLRTQADLLASDLPDEGGARDCLVEYFPPRAIEGVGDDVLDAHRLRREIVSAQLANRLVNMMGATFLERISRDIGTDRGTAAGAWFVADRIVGGSEIRKDLQQLELSHSTATTYRWHLGLSRVIERTARWVLLNVDVNVPVETMVGQLVDGLSELRADFHRTVAGEDRLLFDALMVELQELGIDEPLAHRMATLRFLPELLDILRVAHESGIAPLTTAEAYYVVGERFAVTWLQRLLRETSATDAWAMRLALGLVADSQRANRAIANAVLACRRDSESVEQCVDQYCQTHHVEVAAFDELVEELRTSEATPLAAVGVAIRALMAISEL